MLMDSIPLDVHLIIGDTTVDYEIKCGNIQTSTSVASNART